MAASMTGQFHVCGQGLCCITPHYPQVRAVQELVYRQKQGKGERCGDPHRNTGVPYPAVPSAVQVLTHLRFMETI